MCVNGHCFDIAKSGYVNLLLKNSSGNHGDNKLMARARRDFLDKGYYSPLRDTLVGVLSEFCEKGDVIVDCGCGEGYYTSAIAESLGYACMCGFDISKDALAIASKRSRNVEYAVASSFDIPLKDKSADIILEIFSPHSEKEFKRILKPNGLMVMVIPLEEHLFALKKAIYDTAYKNELSDYEIDGFDLIKSEKIEYKIELNSNEDIKNLFCMTPYYYKTGVKEQARLNTLQQISTEVGFNILVYKKH